MLLTKVMHIGALGLYGLLCYIHLFMVQSKVIALVVYSPLLFVNLLAWFTLLRMTVEMYQTNASDAKII